MASRCLKLAFLVCLATPDRRQQTGFGFPNIGHVERNQLRSPKRPRETKQQQRAVPADPLDCQAPWQPYRASLPPPQAPCELRRCQTSDGCRDPDRTRTSGYVRSESLHRRVTNDKLRRGRVKMKRRGNGGAHTCADHGEVQQAFSRL
jgi:hypothetical protein